jgi:hypothetical protein
MTQGSPLVRFDSTELSNRFELQLQGISVERKINPGAYKLSPQSVWRALEIVFSQSQSLVHVDLLRRQRRLREPAKSKEVSGTSLFQQEV